MTVRRFTQYYVRLHYTEILQKKSFANRTEYDTLSRLKYLDRRNHCTALQVDKHVL